MSHGAAPAAAAGGAVEDKKDAKGKKLKNMLMDFAVSSILDVGMMNLMGNILGKINPDTTS